MFHLKRDLGVDLGTTSVLVYIKGKGVTVREPSVVAVDRASGKLVKAGSEARQMLGRTPGSLAAIQPMQGGVISDFHMTEQMLRRFIRKARRVNLGKPRMVFCIPSGASEVEERAVVEAGLQAGAKGVYLLEEPLAAALGAGLEIAGPDGHLVVDIGGGTTDIGVIALSGVVSSLSIKTAGEAFNEALIRYVRRHHGVLIGDGTAEDVKIAIGTAIGTASGEALEGEMTVKGRCLTTGLPRECTITGRETMEAFREPIARILEGIHHLLENTPPELAGDIALNGITLTGGGSLLAGLDRLIQDTTGIPTRVAEDPEGCVARGTGMALKHLKKMKPGPINLNRKRQLGR